MSKMALKETGMLLCDVCFGDELLVDVKLPRCCSLSEIIQGLWKDEKFRSSVLYVKNNEEVVEKTKKCSLKSFDTADRSILRSFVAVRVLPTWKWLELKDFVADFEKTKETLTVADVFGSICENVHKPVFRVLPQTECEADDQEVKTIVQDLLKTKSLATLAAAGCPLSKGMLSLIGQNKYNCIISSEKREKFVHWLQRQDFKDDAIPDSTDKMTPFKIAKSRVTFDPQCEISKLVYWFDVNQRPDKDLVEEYVSELNEERVKKGKRMLTTESIDNWFKNKRAKTRKEENEYLADPWQDQTATMISCREAKESETSEQNGVNHGDEQTPATLVGTGDENGDIAALENTSKDNVSNDNLVSMATADRKQITSDAGDRIKCEHSPEVIMVGHGGDRAVIE